MATATLTKLWTALFEDGHMMTQPENDRYSKHDDEAEWNPSSFRDVLEYSSPIDTFAVGNVAINIKHGVFRFMPEENDFSLETEPLTDRKLIYYRETRQDFDMTGNGGQPYVVRYAIGYEGKNPEGKIEKKVIFIEA